MSDTITYGLSKEKMFPLSDLKSLERAIQFFEHCPAQKRSELSRNINDVAMSNDFKPTVAKTDLFYRYSHKKLYNIVDDNRNLSYEDKKIVDSLSGDNLIRTTLFTILEYLPSTEQDMFDFEVRLSSVYENLHKKCLEDKAHSLNLFSTINRFMAAKYSELYDKLRYVDDEDISDELLRFNNLVSHMIFDICKLLSDYSIKGDEVVDLFKDKLTLLSNLTGELNINNCVVARELNKVLLDININKCLDEKLTVDKLLGMIKEAVPERKLILIKELSIRPEAIFNYFNKLNTNLLSSESYLSIINSRFKKEVMDTLRSMDITVPEFTTEEPITRLVSEDHRDILNIISTLDKNMDPSCIEEALPMSTYFLNNGDLLFIQANMKPKFLNLLYKIQDKEGTSVYLGVKPTELFLFTKNTYTRSISAVLIYHEDHESYGKLAYKRLIDSAVNISLLVNEVKLDVKEYMSELTQLTEGISINKKGDIEFSFNKPGTLMDEYDQTNKKIIVEWYNKNYDGVKDHLAFLFAMIMKIDKEYSSDSNRLITTAKKKDAAKARMFAINTFQTYMKKLRSVEPRFDFSGYYESKGYDKVSYTLTTDTVQGIKKLVSVIMTA